MRTSLAVYQGADRFLEPDGQFNIIESTDRESVALFLNGDIIPASETCERKMSPCLLALASCFIHVIGECSTRQAANGMLSQHALRSLLWQNLQSSLMTWVAYMNHQPGSIPARL